MHHLVPLRISKVASVDAAPDGNNKAGQEALIRAYGAREIGHGILSLSIDKQSGCGAGWPVMVSTSQPWLRGCAPTSRNAIHAPSRRSSKKKAGAAEFSVIGVSESVISDVSTARKGTDRVLYKPPCR
jgi:hypothetical protein